MLTSLPLVVITLAATTALAEEPCTGFDLANAAVQAMLNDHPELEGAAITVGDSEGVIHQAFFGNYNESTIIPVASASKLLSGVAIMTLIDQNLIDPDAPVRDFLPNDFSLANAGLKSTMTVRQMFAHTSGLPGEDATSTILADQTITLEEAVQIIACCTSLRDVPGGSFAYGGLSMHTAGRVAEVVSGHDWETFFADSVSAPLGLTSIDYQGLGPTTNPRVSGSAQSNLRDFARILQMLVGNGEIDGVRILSEQAVASMYIDQTVGLPVRFAPVTAGDWGYGFGGWISKADDAGNTLEFTSPGAFGFTPWIDLERGVFGIVMVEGSLSELNTEINTIQSAIETQLDTCTGVCRADLAEPLGSLNFFDITAFIDLYNAGQPSADIAAPFGRINFFDVAAYIALYNAGCP
ncbi:MAG: serine hydrolase [Phycisphaerales bacterium]